jgi:hypothetical protein
MSGVQNLQDDIGIMLNQLRVGYKILSLIKNTSVQFVIEDFGLIIVCIDRLDYAQTSNVVDEKFEGWRTMYITTKDNLLSKKYEVIWNLMRCGYMKWLRYNFPRQVRNILLGADNLGARIIEERLRIWNDEPKYKFLIEDNRGAQRNGLQRELSTDPSFFDYMPEEE